MVLNDLRWLRTRVSRLREFTSPFSEFGPWEKEIMGRGRIEDARRRTQEFVQHAASIGVPPDLSLRPAPVP
eukprot:8044791-Pyramimonas_sp.AAC.1